MGRLDRDKSKCEEKTPKREQKTPNPNLILEREETVQAGRENTVRKEGIKL